MAIWFLAVVIDRATNNGTFETINQQLHGEVSWFYGSHYEQNSYQNEWAVCSFHSVQLF
jgi:hypothetical protein